MERKSLWLVQLANLILLLPAYADEFDQIIGGIKTKAQGVKTTGAYVTQLLISLGWLAFIFVPAYKAWQYASSQEATFRQMGKNPAIMKAVYGIGTGVLALVAALFLSWGLSHISTKLTLPYNITWWFGS